VLVRRGQRTRRVTRAEQYSRGLRGEGWHLASGAQLLRVPDTGQFSTVRVVIGKVFHVLRSGFFGLLRRSTMSTDEWPSLKGVHAFVIDDNEDSRRLIEQALEYCGALVTTFAYPDAALEALGNTFRR